MHSRIINSGIVVAGISLLCVSAMLLSPRLYASESSLAEEASSIQSTVECASCSIDPEVAADGIWVAAYTRRGCTGVAIPMPWYAALAACLTGVVKSIKLLPIIGPCINCP